MIELIKRKHTWPHRRTANPIQPIFSSEDADLNDIKWSRSHGYASVTGKTKTDDGTIKNVSVFAHRVVLERKLGRKLQKGEVTDQGLIAAAAALGQYNISTTMGYAHMPDLETLKRAV